MLVKLTTEEREKLVNLFSSLIEANEVIHLTANPLQECENNKVRVCERERERCTPKQYQCLRLLSLIPRGIFHIIFGSECG